MTEILFARKDELAVTFASTPLVLFTADPVNFPSSRVLTDTASILWDLSTAGQVKANIGTLTSANISDFNEAAQDAVGGILTDSVTVDFTYNDAGNTITASVIDDSITDAKLRNSGALSVIGRAANTTGDPADISAALDDQVLRRSGTALGFGAVNLAGANAVTGDLPFANLAQGSARSVLGVTGNATADVASIQSSAANQVLNSTATTVDWTASPTVDNLTATTGLRVGFTGAPGAADRIELGDANFYLDLGAGVPIIPNITFDTQDAFSYTRTTDTFNWIIGNTNRATLAAAAFSPGANDSMALGSATVSFSDLFLATGAVVNWNNGNMTVTQAANSLTVAASAKNILELKQNPGGNLGGTYLSLWPGNTAASQNAEIDVISSLTDAGLSFRMKGAGVLNILGPSDASTSAALALFEDETNGTNSVTLRAAASIPTNYTLTLPSAPPGIDNSPLVSTTAGTLSFDDNSWTTYSPTVTSNTGTITTLGTVTGRYKRFGKTLFFEVSATITTNGTGGGYVNFTLPFTSAAFPFFAFGQELNVTGNLLIGHVVTSSTNMAVTTSTGAYPGGDGRRLVLSGAYETS